MNETLIESIIVPEETKMAASITPSEQRVVLRDIPWNAYEGLLPEQQDKSTPRFTYDQGILEIMSPSYEHEELKDIITLLGNIWAGASGAKIRTFGSATFKREDIKRAFEPDGCFYVQSVDRIRGKKRIDLTTDPPPDIVVEIDITNSSINKFPLFAAIGIPEVWRYDRQMSIFKLESNSYSLIAQSQFLAGLTADLITELIRLSESINRGEWILKITELASKNR